jgi:ATP-dependent DNA helicase DinG
LGIDKISPVLVRDVSLPSPFDYRRNALLYISEATPFPDQSDKAYIAAVTDEVERLIRASHGHAAVLFTSYNMMGL